MWCSMLWDMASGSAQLRPEMHTCAWSVPWQVGTTQRSIAQHSKSRGGPSRLGKPGEVDRSQAPHSFARSHSPPPHPCTLPHTGISGASYYEGFFSNVSRSSAGEYVAVSSRGNFYMTWSPGQAYWQPHNRPAARRVQNMGFTPADKVGQG